jgi:DNA-binding CsgD family transcriptional regulator
MTGQNSIQEIFFSYLTKYQFDEGELNYEKVDQYGKTLQTLSDLGNSGTGIFDFFKRQFIFYSSNFGALLGYNSSDYNEKGQQFFAEKMHPDDATKLSMKGVSILKLFDHFSDEEKLNHKAIYEYRMLNAQNRYIRLIEQYQVLELDSKGQAWLMMNIVDISPNQDESDECEYKLLNFKTGQILLIEEPSQIQYELTKREKEILKLVKAGFLSKEISDKLTISVHTVNTHRQRVLDKLKANNSMEAVAFASRYGLID